MMFIIGVCNSLQIVLIINRETGPRSLCIVEFISGRIKLKLVTLSKNMEMFPFSKYKLLQSKIFPRP